MLVLSRRAGHEIVVGEGDNAVTIKIVQIRGSQVRVGVQANVATPIRRKELLPEPGPAVEPAAGPVPESEG